MCCAHCSYSYILFLITLFYFNVMTLCTLRAPALSSLLARLYSNLIVDFFLFIFPSFFSPLVLVLCHDSRFLVMSQSSSSLRPISIHNNDEAVDSSCSLSCVCDSDEKISIVWSQLFVMAILFIESELELEWNELLTWTHHHDHHAGCCYGERE